MLRRTVDRTWILRYVCSRNWNSKLCSPSLRTLTTVCKLSLERVTLYTRPKSKGHAFFASSVSSELLRPKSSLTVLDPAASSEADLPRNSQRDVRAKPCCGRVDVGWPDLGGGPKTLRGVSGGRVRGRQWVLTGKTTGIPPRTALLPSRAAFSLSHKFSVLPPWLFQLVTVAPYRSTSTLSPEGRVAMTFELAPEPTMSTWASGPAASVALSAEGRLVRSTML